MPRLIWVFTGHTGHFVGFVIFWDPVELYMMFNNIIALTTIGNHLCGRVPCSQCFRSLWSCSKLGTTSVGESPLFTMLKFTLILFNTENHLCGTVHPVHNASDHSDPVQSWEPPLWQSLLFTMLQITQILFKAGNHLCGRAPCSQCFRSLWSCSKHSGSL